MNPIDPVKELEDMRHKLMRGIHTAVDRGASARIATLMFETALDALLPLGALDRHGRDPDNIVRSPFS